MNPKKVTRIFFYGLAIASAATILSMIILFFTANWEDLWPVVVILTSGVAISALFKLANWAFTPDIPKISSDFPVPTSQKDKTNA